MIVREMTYNDIASVADVDRAAFSDAWKKGYEKYMNDLEGGNVNEKVFDNVNIIER